MGKRVLSVNQWNHFKSQHNSMATESTAIGQAASRTSTGNLGTAFNLRPSSQGAHTTELERLVTLPIRRAS